MRFFHHYCNAWKPLEKKLSSRWFKRHQQQLWRHHHGDTRSHPSFCRVRKQMIIRWGDMRKIRRVINYFSENKNLCAEALTWWSRTPFVSSPGSLVLIAIRNCLTKLSRYSPLMMWHFWRSTIKMLLFTSPKMRTSPSLERNRLWSSLSLHCLFVWHKVINPILLAGLENVQWNQLDLPQMSHFRMMWSAWIRCPKT